MKKKQIEAIDYEDFLKGFEEVVKEMEIKKIKDKKKKEKK